MSDVRAKLKWEPDDYRPDYLAKMDEKELRAEYTKLRDIAQKRLKRLAGSEFAETEYYQDYASGFKKLKEIKNKTELAIRLADIGRFVSSERSSVSGMRKARVKFVKNMNKAGYDFVTYENGLHVLEFLDHVRQKAKARQYDSERIIDVAVAAEAKGVDASELEKNFRLWLDNKKALEAWKPKAGEPVTAESFRKYLDDKEKKKTVKKLVKEARKRRNK